MHIPNRLQECRDPSAMCAPICLYYFRCTYRTGCKNAETAETRATCICVHLYLLLSWILFMLVFHFPKSAKFSSTHWNEFHFSKMKRFDVPSFFLWSNHQSCFETITGSDAFQVKLQLALCLQGPMRLLFVLENAMVLWWFIYFAFRCTDREVSEQDQQHPQPCFKIQDQDKVNFKLLSRSFNTSTFQITQQVFQHFEKCSWPAARPKIFPMIRFLPGPVCFFLIMIQIHD